MGYALCCAPSCRPATRMAWKQWPRSCWYATNDQVEKALRLYEAHAERLFSGNQAALQDALNPLAARARENPAALEILHRLMNQSGQPLDHAQNAEAIELQAHAA